MATVALTRVTKSATLIVERIWWTEEYLIDQLFLKLATTKYNSHSSARDCGITVYKYYNQALKLRKYIPLVPPTAPEAKALEFVVNLSDLTPRLIAELQAPQLDDSYTIVKLAVGRIFENIDSEQYHLSIASKLKVRIDK
jgi:hypothetical protein